MIRPGQRVATVLGITVAVLVAVTVPGVYVASSLSRSHAELRTAAEITAGLVMDLIAISPENWEYQEPRLVHLIEQDPGYAQLSGHWEVLNRRGEVLASVGEKPLVPIVTVSAPLFDAGAVVGQVQASASLRKIADMGAALMLLGLALGIAVYLTVRKLTDIRQRAEDALREREARYRAIVETSIDGFWVLDATGRILEVNDRYLCRSGYTREELLGLRLSDIDATNNRDQVEASLATEGSRIFEASHRAKDGSAWPLEVSTIYLPGESGRRYSFLRDISERKRVEQELKRNAETLAAVMAKLTMAEEQERRAIAMDLHDDLSQLLAAANIRLRALPKEDGSADYSQALRETAKLIEQAERSARSLSFQISPPLLFDLGLVPALEWLADELRKVYGLTAMVSDDGEPKNLAATARAVLYRATRELLINVARHAKVEFADVDVRNDEGLLVISVTDYGVGFDKTLIENRAPGPGFGLMSMRERLRLIGGTFDIDSHPGDGTVATLAVPLAAKVDATHGVEM